ncbi:transcriptional regulator [Chitinophaga parva]|jgi:DNA-binding HxlR family transcriptional regulator|uniref:Transcriptional regulator n=1 Tax=Chitinophaga parva TaxID=2169414 RepID=A0A2T7BCE1_9BACT|nr:helix-turn-helix domain-containing protein [Chitinophaga parva]PUZ22764.1 transcriptional regulator [Chitinophaga parva]
MRKTQSTNSLNATTIIENCGMAISMTIFGGRWKPAILFYLSEGRMRYGALRAAIPGISERMLIQQLKELEKYDIVRRIAYPEVPPRVEYELTDNGLTLVPLMKAMSAWGESQRENMARFRFAAVEQ